MVAEGAGSREPRTEGRRVVLSAPHTSNPCCQMPGDRSTPGQRPQTPTRTPPACPAQCEAQQNSQHVARAHKHLARAVCRQDGSEAHVPGSRRPEARWRGAGGVQQAQGAANQEMASLHAPAGRRSTRGRSAPAGIQVAWRRGGGAGAGEGGGNVHPHAGLPMPGTAHHHGFPLLRMQFTSWEALDPEVPDILSRIRDSCDGLPHPSVPADQAPAPPGGHALRNCVHACKHMLSTVQVYRQSLGGGEREPVGSRGWAEGELQQWLCWEAH